MDREKKGRLPEEQNNLRRTGQLGSIAFAHARKLHTIFHYLLLSPSLPEYKDAYYYDSLLTLSLRGSLRPEHRNRYSVRFRGISSVIYAPRRFDTTVRCINLFLFPPLFFFFITRTDTAICAHSHISSLIPRATPRYFKYDCSITSAFLPLREKISALTQDLAVPTAVTVRNHTTTIKKAPQCRP